MSSGLKEYSSRHFMISVPNDKVDACAKKIKKILKYEDIEYEIYIGSER